MTTTVSPGGAIVRGTVVFFESTPLDEDSAPVEPSSVTLTITYISPATGLRVAASPIAMSPASDGSYSASWDSSVAGGGRVDWHVRDVSPGAADEGAFQLYGNSANPGDDNDVPSDGGVAAG